jgi:hypothetical protein
LSEIGVPYGIRTRVAAVRGQCPRPLDEGDLRLSRQYLIMEETARPFWVIFIIFFKGIETNGGIE